MERLPEISVGLVLASSMKRFFFILMGALTIGSVAYGVIGVFARWYGSRFIKSDSDINDIYIVFLGILALGVIGGGALGNWLHRRYFAPPPRGGA